MYLLVEFVEDKEVAVIPDTWLDGEFAKWPSHVRSTLKTNLMVKQKTSPEKWWSSFPVRQLYQHGMYFT